MDIKMPSPISIIPIPGIPEIKPGDDLVKIVIDTTLKQDTDIRERDVIVFAHKIVSKSEGRIARIQDISPSDFSVTAGKMLDKDPRFVELILRESRRIVKMDNGRLIVENAQGITCANAGGDLSNVSGGEEAVLLPVNPDESAKRLADGFKRELGFETAVVIRRT